MIRPEECIGKNSIERIEICERKIEKLLKMMFIPGKMESINFTPHGQSNTYIIEFYNTWQNLTDGEQEVIKKRMKTCGWNITEHVKYINAVRFSAIPRESE